MEPEEEKSVFIHIAETSGKTSSSEEERGCCQSNSPPKSVQHVKPWPAPKPASCYQSRLEQTIDRYGYDPGSFIWKWRPKGAKYAFQTDCNIADLQYQCHFMKHIDEDTEICMNVENCSATEKSQIKIKYEEWTRISDIEAVWHLVAWPPTTWLVLENELNDAFRFTEFDTNDDGKVSTAECAEFFRKQGYPEQEVVKKTEKLFAVCECGDDDGAEKSINYAEFKQKFLKEEEQYFNSDWNIRMWNFTFVVLIPIVGLFVLAMNPSVKISVLIGVSIQAMYVVYFSTIGYYFVRGSKVVSVEDYNGRDTESHYLYRVFTRSGRAATVQGNWAPLSMALNQVAWPLKCIHSVSEFSAVDGAIPHAMLSSIGQYTWAMVVMHFMIEFAVGYEQQQPFSLKLSDVCQLVGVSGLVMLGTFEAEPYNPSINQWHLIGAFAGFGTALGYFVQQMENGSAASVTLSVLLLVLFVVFYALWQISLSICYFKEAEAWGMYSAQGFAKLEEARQKESSKSDEKTKARNDASKLSLCCEWSARAVCSLCGSLGAFLGLAFVVGPLWYLDKCKHKRYAKSRLSKDCGNCDASSDKYEKQKKSLVEFQPALPNWLDYVTPRVKRRITAFSLANVTFESIVLIVGSTSLSLWLMSYDNQCVGWCVEQVVMLIFLAVLLLFGFFATTALAGVFKQGEEGLAKDIMSASYDKNKLL